MKMKLNIDATAWVKIENRARAENLTPEKYVAKFLTTTGLANLPKAKIK